MAQLRLGPREARMIVAALRNEAKRARQEAKASPLADVRRALAGAATRYTSLARNVADECGLTVTAEDDT